MKKYDFEIVLYRGENIKDKYFEIDRKIGLALSNGLGEKEDSYALGKIKDEVYVTCNVAHESVSRAIDWSIKKIKQNGYHNIVGTRFIKKEKKMLEEPNKNEKL